MIQVVNNEEASIGMFSSRFAYRWDIINIFL